MKATRILLLALLAACSIALVACGGDDDDGNVDADAATSSDDDSGSTDDNDSESTDGDVALSDISEECMDASLAASAVYGQGAAAFTGNTDAVEESADKLKEFAGKAPDEIKEEFEVMAEALQKYYEALDDLDLGSGVPSASELAKIASASEVLNDPDFQEASDRVSDWVGENCES
jgi:hypothetical protein